MATNTYVPLGDFTLASAASELVLTNFPSTYTDLVVVFSGLATGQNTRFRINGDDVANTYSRQIAGWYGTTKYSGSAANESYANVVTLFDNEQSSWVLQFSDYASTTKYKSWLFQSQDGNYSGSVATGMWSFVNPILSLQFFMGSGNIPAGATYKIFGIES